MVTRHESKTVSADSAAHFIDCSRHILDVKHPITNETRCADVVGRQEDAQISLEKWHIDLKRRSW